MNLITKEAHARCTAHTLAEQLAAWHEFEERRLAYVMGTLKKRHESGEWEDVDAAFEADQMNTYKRGFE